MAGCLLHHLDSKGASPSPGWLVYTSVSRGGRRWLPRSLQLTGQPLGSNQAGSVLSPSWASGPCQVGSQGGEGTRQEPQGRPHQTYLSSRMLVTFPEGKILRM